MSDRYLTPGDIQSLFQIKRTKAFELLKEYEESGGEVIRIGARTRRVSETRFIEFLRGRNEIHAQ